MRPYIVTVKQFGCSFLPVLVKVLVDEYEFRHTDARHVGRNILTRLEGRFGNNTMPVTVFHEAIGNIVVRETNKFRRLMDKNFGLSEEVFEQMVVKMRNGDEQLFEAIFLAHFKSCLSYVQTRYNATYENAYDASMNALVSFCTGLKEGSIGYGNLRFLFTQMAGQYYLKWIRKETPKESIEGIDVPEEDTSFDHKNLDIMDKAWELLGSECKKLLEHFYHKGDQLKDIAKKHEKNPSAIRKQKQRCINRLRGYFVQMNH